MFCYITLYNYFTLKAILLKYITQHDNIVHFTAKELVCFLFTATNAVGPVTIQTALV